MLLKNLSAAVPKNIQVISGIVQTRTLTPDSATVYQIFKEICILKGALTMF